MQYDGERGGGEEEDRDWTKGYKKRCKEKRDCKKKKTEKLESKRWMGREDMNENREKVFCKRRLIKDLPKMPVTLRVPLWLLI